MQGHELQFSRCLMFAQADVAPNQKNHLCFLLTSVQIPVLVLSLPLSHPDVQVGQWLDGTKLSTGGFLQQSALQSDQWSHQHQSHLIPT